MGGFFRDLLRYEFLQNAMLTGVLASICCGVVGTYVVTRRISYIAGSISHCILGGIGVARYLQVARGMTWMEPLYGATASAILAALIIGFVSLRAKEREDTIIGALWAIGMAVGLLFMARTPGYNADLMAYLFGNILMVTPKDLWLVFAIDVVVLGCGLAFYNQLQAVCFDEEFARMRGVRVEFYYLLLLCLTALTVVLLVSVVGIILVIALLTLPAAVAGHFSRTIRQMMLLSSVLCAAFIFGGLTLQYGPNLPAGPTIIAVAGVAYFCAVLVAAGLRRMRRRFVAPR